MNGPIILFITIIIGFILWLFVFNAYPMKSQGCKKREGLENANLYPAAIDDLRQIYDNLYFDTLNGNVLELTISETSTTTKDAQGKDVTTTKKEIEIENIYSRDKGNKVDKSKYTISGESVKSASASADSISSSYDKFNITTAEKVQMFYIGWDTDTYIHIIDLEKDVGSNKTAPQNVMTVAYDKTGSPGTMKSSTFVDSIITVNTQAYTPNMTDNRMQVIPVYDLSKSVFKIVDGVYYDVTNGSLITQAQNGINVYERKSQSASGCSTPTPKYISIEGGAPGSGTSVAIIDVGFCTWTLQVGDFLVLYIGNGKKTVVSVMNIQTNSKEYSNVTVARFLANGTLDNGSSLNSLTDGQGGSMNNYINTNLYDNDMQIVLQMMQMEGKMPMGLDKTNPLSDYYRWVEYWNKQSGTDLYSKMPNSEYILKSQIVPPVCPRCPSCPSSGVCTTCGGNGGSGTQVSDKDKEDDKDGESKGVSGFLKDSGSGVKDFLEDTGSGAKDLLQDTGSGVKDVAYDTASAAKGAVSDVYGETKDVVSDVYGEAKGVVSDVYGGVKGLFQRNPTNVGQINTSGAAAGGISAAGANQQFGVYSNAPQTQGSDHMTYFGALQPKGDSNYIPVTADFSAFRR